MKYRHKYTSSPPRIVDNHVYPEPLKAAWCVTCNAVVELGPPASDDEDANLRCSRCGRLSWSALCAEVTDDNRRVADKRDRGRGTASGIVSTPSIWPVETNAHFSALSMKLSREARGVLPVVERKVYSEPVTVHWTLTAPASEVERLEEPESDGDTARCRKEMREYLEACAAHPCTGKTRRGTLVVKPWHMESVTPPAVKPQPIPITPCPTMRELMAPYDARKEAALAE